MLEPDGLTPQMTPEEAIVELVKAYHPISEREIKRHLSGLRFEGTILTDEQIDAFLKKLDSDKKIERVILKPH